MSTTRTRNAKGQFVSAKKATAKATVKATRKPAVKAVDPAKAERAAAKAEALAARAALLTLAQARADLAKKERAVATAERAGSGVVTARIKASTAKQVLAIVEARQSTPAPEQKRSRRAVRRSNRSLVNA